jgi:starch synthase
MRPLKICLVSSECTPFAKTGGLADVVAALGRFLGKRGHDVRIVMPMYSRIKNGGYEFYPVTEAQDVSVRLANRTYWFSVSTLQLPRSSAKIWLVRCPELYEREGIYTQDGDEHLRFAMLARATFAICQQTQWAPDVLHCNDWHAGLIPLYKRSLYGWDRLFQDTRTVLTIHNIGYQGTFGADVIPSLGLENERALLWQEDLHENRINFLKTGLLYADAITTVSRTYAQEIQGDELGMGLAPLLRQRADSVTGIVNGVDYEEWNPRDDVLIPHSYSPKDMSGKLRCKEALMKRFGMQPDLGAPAFGIVSRLTFQKGFELLAESLTVLLHRENMRLFVLGSGEEKYENYFRWLQDTFPGKVAYDHGYKEDLAHHIEAGTDIFLMPSRYEPCGLNQMYSQKYGTVPIVRRTGGLADTVEQWDPKARTGTGFLFGEFTPDALMDTIRFALACWKDRAGWEVLQRNGMERDFSWERQGEEYVDLYRRLAPAERRGAPDSGAARYTGLGEPPAPKATTLVPQAKILMRSAREHAVEKQKRAKNHKK